jgi:phenylacetate-CoA ligase
VSGDWLRLKLRKSSGDVDRAVRWIVRHANDHVPYYAEAFARAEVRIDAIRGAADLPRLPVVRRDDLLTAGTQGFLRAGADVRALVCRHTTGTTGTPVNVYMTRTEALFRTLSLLDAYRRNVRIPPAFTLVDVGPERKDHATRSVQRVGPVRIVRLFRSLPVSEHVALLRRTRPTLVEGRPSMLWQVARVLEVEGVTAIRPRLVISYAEALYPRVRELLERVFVCRVVDYYNCEEAGNLAWECPDRPELMHPNPATVCLEVVGPDGRPAGCGVEGSVVITNLFNATMPFVRYAMGDRAALVEPGHCSCGFDGPAMRLVDGRDEDFFVLPDGREISPRVIYDVVNTALPAGGFGGVLAEAIRGFQIVQEERARIIVRVVPGPRYSADLWRDLDAHVRALHPTVRVEVVRVDALEPGPGGKFRQVTSRVRSAWHPSGADASATIAQPRPRSCRLS